MVKKSKIKKNSMWIKWGLFPLLLLGVWVVLTIWYIISFDQSTLVLSNSHPKESFTNITFDKLLKGEKISGEFIANENNLGIVALRFQKFERVAYQKEDSLRFSLKEKGSKTWYYQNNYRSGFIYDMQLLPIGFPLIADSKGKIYQFELESLKGNNENAMALSKREPILFSKYQFDKSFILSSTDNILNFGSKKLINSFQTIDVLYSSFVFLLPLLIYLLWISPFKNLFIDPSIKWLRMRGYIPGSFIINKILQYIFLTLVTLVIAFDIFILQIHNDILYIVIIAIWIILFNAYRLDSRFTFISGFTCLVFTAAFVEINIYTIAEKSAIWAFIFFVTAVIQVCRENTKNKSTV